MRILFPQSGYHALIEIALIAVQNGDIDRAVEFFEKASAGTEFQSLAAGALLMAGDSVLRPDGDNARARDLYRRALLLFPDGVHHSELRRKLMTLSGES